MYRRLWLVLIALLPGMAQASMEADELRDMLEQMQGQALWGEAVLAGGQVRSIQVVSLASDSVAVREVIGPLQERPAMYALSDFTSLRELGERRIPLRRALYQPRKSTVGALGLEVLPILAGAGLVLADHFSEISSVSNIPRIGFSVGLTSGLGYLYIGEFHQGFMLMGVSTIAVTTAIATGEDGAAGWVPISAWIKVASLLHLRDEVQAMNHAADEAERGGNSRLSQGLDRFQRDLRVGGLPGQQGMVPAVQVRVVF